MTITFSPLTIPHLQLLFKWLMAPHVRAWWDQDIDWTRDKIHEKFGSYIEGFKLEEGVRKPMHAYIFIKAQHNPRLNAIL